MPNHVPTRLPPGAGAVILVNALLAFLGLVYGLDSAWPAPWRDGVYASASVVMLAGLALLLVLAMSRATWRQANETGDAQVWIAALCPVLCLLQLSLTLFFNLPTKLALPAIATAWFGGALLAWRAGAGAAIAWALAIGFTLFLGVIATTPHDVGRADMLAFIGHAIDVFSAGGDPYTADYGAIDDNPFFYPPAQWLIYLPVRRLGVDLRALNLASAAAMVVIVEWRARRHGPSIRIGIYPIMLSALALPLMHSGQVWPYWCAILAFGLLALGERWVWAAAAAASALGMRQTALIPAMAVMAANVGRVRLSRWLAAVGAGAAVVALTTLPFLRSAAALRAFVIDGPRRAVEQAHLQGNPGNQIALSNLLDRLGMMRWDSAVEIAFLALTGFGAWRVRTLGTTAILAVAGIGYALTVAANPYLHRYYYVAGLLLAGIAFSAEDPAKRRLRA